MSSTNNKMKVAFINIHRQSGFTKGKVIELEEFIELYRLDIVCLQETNIEPNTFSDSKIPERFNIITNNSKNGFGTCMLVRRIFSYENVIMDTDGRLICLDINNVTITNLYLLSGTDHASKTARENYIDNIPNYLLYKKENGIIGGDLNSIVDKKDSLNYPEQKISKCFKKLISLYDLTDSYRELYPHSKMFSRFYTSKGVSGATRIDRCYTWGKLTVTEAEYLPVSFSDHFAHVVTFENFSENINSKPTQKSKSIYKIKHHIVDDKIFQDKVKNEFPNWLSLQEGLCPIFWWEEVVKPGIRSIALSREREMNAQRRRKIAALQLRMSFHLKRLKTSSALNLAENIRNLERIKSEIKMFYEERAKIILRQNKAEEFDMSDSTKLYHYESHKNYMNESKMEKLEVDGLIYEGQEQIENIMHKKLEETLSKTFSLDENACEELFSFDVPKISAEVDELLHEDISSKELEIALKQLNSKASPGIDGIPSTLYVKLIDLFLPHIRLVFNCIVKGGQPSKTMRTSTIQFLTKPKKASSIKLSDKRRISVLCTDFKCLETVFANRLTKIMPQFISNSQYACKPRKIHQGISAARNVISMANKRKENMAIMALDMKSGFDLLQMDFVYFCMKKYGFSEKTINIFKNIYGSAIAVLVVNGAKCKEISDLLETLRQGGSGSMQIFIIGVNPIIQLLEKELEGIELYSQPIHGPVLEHEKAITPRNQTEKIIGYVDDLNPVITKPEEFEKCNSCLIKFETASGCQFHRDPASQKCKVMPLGKWKEWLTQENAPLPFLQVSQTLEILGTTLHEKWIDTRRTAGERVVAKVKYIRNRWRGGRFYDLLLRPYAVNTYMFSNVWAQAGVIDLRIGDSTLIQRQGNDYIYASSNLRPEQIANYLSKEDGGLGTVHVKSKAKALFIKNILEESGSNIYMNAVVRKYCKDEEVYPIPVKPEFMDKSFIDTMKYVLEKMLRLSTKHIYDILLKREFGLEDGDFKFKNQLRYDDFSMENVIEITTSKYISLPVRTFVWKLAHNLIQTEIEEAKFKNRVPTCKLCLEVDISKSHIYFSCYAVQNVANSFLNVLRIFDPQYSFEEILLFKIMPEHPQLSWFIANTLYYIENSRGKCTLMKYQTFMLTEFETFNLSRHATDEMKNVVKMMIELIETDY